MDATLTGCSSWDYGESILILDSEYNDDTAIIFKSHANISDGVSSIILHFACFGTKIHTRLIHPTGESKTDIILLKYFIYV